MVCYARPAGLLAALLVAAWLVFSGPVSHFFGSAAVPVTVVAAVAVAALGAAAVLATFRSVRRRRAAAGGCVSCRFRCQHAMTGQPRQRWLVTTADRRAPAGPGSPGHPGMRPDRSAPVLLPVPALNRSAPVLLPVPALRRPAPRWPDRPAYRASQGPVTRRERAGAPT